MEIYRSHINLVEHIVEIRNRIQVMCEDLAFDISQQLQVATSVFEMGKWILEQGEGDIVVSLLTEGETFVIETQAFSPDITLDSESVENLLDPSAITSSSSLKGIPAIRRLMDEVEITTPDKGGVIINATKRRAGASGKLAKNIVGFFQEKFRSISSPTLYDDLRAQNINIAQSLSLYEEKTQELERKNIELNKVRKALEDANAELHEKTAELQHTLLTLGDRTAQLTAQNKRFSAVLEHVSQGVLVTDRTRTIVEVNDYFLNRFGLEREKIINTPNTMLSEILSKYSGMSASEWEAAWALLKDKLDTIWTTDLNTEQGTVSCRSIPIKGPDSHFLGRVWIVS